MNALSKYIDVDKLKNIGGGDKGSMYLWLLLVGTIIAIAGISFYLNKNDVYDRERIGYTGEQRVSSQRMVKYALEAAGGDDEAFGKLKQVRERFQQTLGFLRDGNPETGLPTSPVDVNDDLIQIELLWKNFSKASDAIIPGKGAIQSVQKSAQDINDLIPQLLALSDEVASVLVENGAQANQIYIASRQLMLIQRIGNNASKVLEGGRGSATAADRFGRDATLFGRVVDGMLKGNKRMRIVRVADDEARERLQQVSELFATLSQHVGAILQKSPDVVKIQEAAGKMAVQGDAILEAATVLTESYVTAPQRRPVGGGVMLLLGILALATLVTLGYTTVQVARRRQTQAESLSKRNEEAILRLLDEMGNLADGDLTVNATVTDDFTGAIADSMNYTIEQLRTLVNTINETTVQVSSAAQQTQATAMHLAEASDNQATQITDASSSINEMAVSIEDVSKGAATLADEAHKSVSIANEGAEAVQNTIAGMDTIREQIQETSKRIKRLGESSQEIGEIVELINDISDQTNILALNAAIQAAMAGEAGRGFAVVADEVQRLAERSGNATKQIEALVKTIQTDTNEAVISMESSTAGVVEGAQLAQNAGQSLENIEKVSNHLAQLIQDISSSAHQQSNAATNVSETMNVIQEITTQTSAGTNETAASIGNLAELANELRKSVAGFKLPQ